MQQINIPLILNSLGFEKLNEIQQASLEANAKNDNIVLLSATGSGKTLAFLLPLLETLDPEINNVQALIIVPSRELAIQIDDVFRKMQTGFKVTLCYGGHKRETEENNLKEAPALIIGTAGRQIIYAGIILNWIKSAHWFWMNLINHWNWVLRKKCLSLLVH
jgi:superfamily II DNA/RNA helicase